MPAQAASPRNAAHPSLSQFCAGIRLTDGGRALIDESTEPLAFARLLLERGLFADGINVLARVFSKREGVWWACQCTRQSLDESLAASKSQAAIAAAEAWVADPVEETRRPLFALAQSAGMDTAAGLVAFAAFASSGSLAPPEFEAIPPEDAMTAELVAGSVLMAGVSGASDTVLERFRLFLEQGLGLCEEAAT